MMLWDIHSANLAQGLKIAAISLCMVLEHSAASSDNCAHFETSGAQLIQGIVQALEDGLAILAWGGLQCILWGHSKGEESDNVEVVCHCCVPQRPDELHQEHYAIKALHNHPATLDCSDVRLSEVGAVARSSHD